ncbi:MAG: hypothetical protein AAF211_02240 [Myxococcota bacterium]
MSRLRWSAAQSGRLDRLRVHLVRAQPRFAELLGLLHRWPKGSDRDYAIGLVAECTRIPDRERRADDVLRQRLLAGTAPAHARLVRVLDLRRRGRRERSTRQHSFVSRARLQQALRAVGPLRHFAANGFGQCNLDDGFDDLVELQPGLRSVSLHHRYDLGAAQVGRLLDRLPRLRRLDLTGCPVDPLALAGLPQLNQLVMLRVSMVGRAFDVLQASPHLRRGTLRRGRGAASVAPAPAIEELSRLPISLHALWAGDETARAVLRDRALESDLKHLAEVLA